MDQVAEYLEDQANLSRTSGRAYKRMVEALYNDQTNKDGKEFSLEKAMEKTRALLDRDLKKLRRETKALTDDWREVPHLSGKEVARIQLRGPTNFSSLLNNFEPGAKETDKSDKQEKRPAPYPKGKGGKNFKGKGKKY